jgi:hypothetical protein
MSESSEHGTLIATLDMVVASRSDFSTDGLRSIAPSYGRQLAKSVERPSARRVSHAISSRLVAFFSAKNFRMS